MSERVSDEELQRLRDFERSARVSMPAQAEMWAGVVDAYKRVVEHLEAENAKLRAACQRYFDATSELRTDATFDIEEAEREYADAYNALYELVSPRKAKP